MNGYFENMFDLIFFVESALMIADSMIHRTSCLAAVNPYCERSDTMSVLLYDVSVQQCISRNVVTSQLITNCCRFEHSTKGELLSRNSLFSTLLQAFLEEFLKRDVECPGMADAAIDSIALLVRSRYFTLVAATIATSAFSPNTKCHVNQRHVCFESFVQLTLYQQERSDTDTDDRIRQFMDGLLRSISLRNLVSTAISDS